MGKRYSKEIKEEVLGKIHDGQKLSAVAKAYGISEMTVQSWMVRDTEE